MRSAMLTSTAAIALAALLAIAPGIAGADTTTDTQGQTTTETTTDAEVMTEAEVEAQQGVDAADLMGDSVENPDGDVLGDIETLIVADDGQIEHVVIGVGGFLGIGEKEVALPWDRIEVLPEDDRIVANVTREELEGMPEFDWPENYRQGELITGRNDVNEDGVDDSAQIAEQSTDGTATTTTGAVVDADNVDNVDNDNDNDDAAKVDDAGETLQPNAEVLAGSLIGAMILSHDDREVGEVDDLVIAADGTAQGVIVEIGGFLGIDEKHVMIGWKDLEVRRDDDGDVLVRTGLNEEAMEALQDYDVEAARSGEVTSTTTNQ